jgi:magnesium and cobalt exporter, CNNM family
VSGADWAILAVVVVLFVASIWLAAAETAFVRMNRIRAIALQEEGARRAKRLVTMLEHPERTLNVVLLLVLVAQLTSATLLGVLLEGAAGALGVVLGIVLQIVLFFVVGEVAPKTYAVQHTERAALALTPALWFLTNFAPLRWSSRMLIGIANVVLPGKGLKQGPFVTEEEIRTMADVAASEDVIEGDERQLIHSIFEFGDTVVREVMLPRPDMVAIDADDTIETAIDRAIEHGFSRLPVCEDHSTDNIIGLVYLKDLVRRARAGEAGAPVRVAVRPAIFVPEQKRVAELLREMRTKQFHMAIVIDEHGDTSGLVTLEDLLEEIVGEIADEYDVEAPAVERLPDGSLRVPGRTPIDEVSEILGVELPDTEWDTVSGLVFNLLGHVPEEGETVGFPGLEIRTERVQGRRIESLVIRRVSTDDAPSEDGASGDVVAEATADQHASGSPPP